MHAYQKERFLNAVCFFAKEHSLKTGRPAFQTYIYKYLSLFDFAMLREKGQPALGIDYTALEKGPVPRDLYSKKEATSHYQFLKVCSPAGKDLYVIDPIVAPDTDFFSEREIEVMRSIISEFASQDVHTEQLIDATHDRIPAWQKAWARRGENTFSPMSYDDEFSPDEQTESAERYQLYKALKNGSRRRSKMERV